MPPAKMRYDIHTGDSAPWYALVTAAEAVDRRLLPQEVERYLVTTLLRFLGRGDLAPTLRSVPAGPRSRVPVKSHRTLRNLGDRCLIYTGLFAEQMAQAQMPAGYYVAMGRRAYARLGHRGDPLFTRLSDYFVQLMDLLQTMRELDDGHASLDPLSAYQLWHDTGSRHAWRVLCRASAGTPCASGQPAVH